MLKSNFYGFIGCDADYEDAKQVIFGAPFDSTTSYRPGTRFASKAIRSESFGIETYSPYQDKDLADCKIFDYGDLELPFGDTRRALDQIRELAATVLRDDKIPVMLGGEHLVSLGVFEAVHAKYPDVCIIHFDAHCDLREDYLGCRLSHASVIRRCYDIIGDDRIYQFGIRSGDREEFEFSRQGHTFMNKYNLNGLDEIIEKLQDKKVYFTVDLDVLDPSVFAGTGTPEAGGITFTELMNAIVKICSGLNIAGCDLVELCPGLDQSGVSTAVACKLLRELLLALQ